MKDFRNYSINVKSIEHYNYNPMTGKVSNPNPRARKYDVELVFDASSPMPFYSFKRKNTVGYQKVSIDEIVKGIFPERFNKPYVRHIDGNPFHNHLNNLEGCEYPETIDSHIKEKIALKEQIVESDFINHPVAINQIVTSDSRKFAFVGNYSDTKMLYFPEIEYNYCFSKVSGEIVNKKNHMVLKPKLHILSSIKCKGDVPVYVFYPFTISQNKKDEKLEHNPNAKSFTKQICIDEICQFIDPEKFNKPYVKHINGNLLDNRLENLEPSDEREIMTKDMFKTYTKLMDVEYDEDSIDKAIAEIEEAENLTEEQLARILKIAKKYMD